MRLRWKAKKIVWTFMPDHSWDNHRTLANFGHNMQPLSDDQLLFAALNITLMALIY